MTAYVITNPVPTPEEMGEILGLSPDRVKAVRAIMSRPGQKTAGASGKLVRKATKKASRVRRGSAKK